MEHTESVVTAPVTVDAVRTLQKSTKLRQYVNIIRELAIVDFRLKYHDSVLGYVWSMLNPLLMFGVYLFVFTKIFTSAIQYYPLFLIIGIVNYAFFQDCTFSGMTSISAKAGIIKKIYFPRSIIVFAASGTCLISYLINLSVVFFFIIFMKGFSPLMLLMVIPMIYLVLFAMGISFLLVTLYAYFRDVGQIWGVLLLAIFWVSPVVYNVETLPAPISTVVYFNPLTRIFVILRHFMLYQYQNFDFRFIIMTAVYSAATFAVGYFVFRKHQDKFSELF